MKEKTAKSNIKTRAVIGIVLCIICAALFCVLIMTDKENALNKFLVGVFGISVYGLLVVLFGAGILLTLDRLRVKALNTVFMVLLYLGIVLFVHQVASYDVPGPLNIVESYTFNEYIIAVYDLQIVTFGGVAAAVIVYPLNSLIGIIGSYVVYTVVLGVSIYFTAIYLLTIEPKGKPQKPPKDKKPVPVTPKPAPVVEKTEPQPETVAETVTSEYRPQRPLEVTPVQPQPIVIPQVPSRRGSAEREEARKALYVDNFDKSAESASDKSTDPRDILFNDEAKAIGDRRRSQSHIRSYDPTRKRAEGEIPTAPVSVFDTDNRPPKIIHEGKTDSSILPPRRTDDGTARRRTEYGYTQSTSSQRPNKSANKDLLKYKEADLYGTGIEELPPIINGDEESRRLQNEPALKETAKPKLNRFGYPEDENLSPELPTQFYETFNAVEEKTRREIPVQGIEPQVPVQPVQPVQPKRSEIPTQKQDDEPTLLFEDEGEVEDEHIDIPFDVPEPQEAVVETPPPQKQVKIVERQVAGGRAMQMSVAEIDPDSIFKPRAYKYRNYKAPPKSLLKVPDTVTQQQDDLQATAAVLEQTLREFNITATVKNIICGPSVALYEMELAPGITINKVMNIAKDITRDVSASGPLRILSHIPGKKLFGIEVPLENARTVYLRTVIESKSFLENGKLRFALGVDIENKCVAPDLGDMPHLLMGGSTGYGKSVCLNSLIVSLMYRYSPEQLRFILVDPKRVEFNDYVGMPHMLMPRPVNSPEKAINAFNWLVDEMERRYVVFAECKVRNIDDYNKLIDTALYEPMPRIVLIVDELSDLMSFNKQEMESKILRLTQKARASGIHVVLATQRPSVDVITGTIKSNLPARIALKVISANDSKTIFDTGGPEKLCRKGDMLYQKDGTPQRLQGALVLDNEVQAVVSYIKENNEAHFNDEADKSINVDKKQDAASAQPEENSRENDPYFVEALKLAITSGNASISMIQRKFRIGFGRAGSLVEAMEAKGYVGQQEQHKARTILISKEEFNDIYGATYGEI